MLTALVLSDVEQQYLSVGGAFDRNVLFLGDGSAITGVKLLTVQLN